MRSKALSFLLSLSLMFCVGFGSSITASALNMNDLAVSGLVNSYYLGSTAENNQLRFIVWSGSVTSYDKQISLTGNNIYQLDNAAISSASTFRIGTPSVRYDFPYVNELYDYYILINYYSKQGDVSFVPSSVGTYDYSDYPNSRRVWFEEFYILPSSDSTNKGFRILAKLPDIENFSFNVVDLVGSGSLAPNMIVEGLIFCFDKNSDSGASSIIAAINNQTSELGGKIDGAADDIQQSIEDQYGGDPGSSFPVDDIITQHNEKMGVLSFSSEALMQVLGLLSPDQTLSSELVFPSMSLTIAGQRNKVQLWPEYRFDLNTLKQYWPDFVGLMQSLTSALVWIFVLRYCYRVFEKYFLAGGSS